MWMEKEGAVEDGEQMQRRWGEDEKGKKMWERYSKN